MSSRSASWITSAQVKWLAARISSAWIRGRPTYGWSTTGPAVGSTTFCIRADGFLAAEIFVYVNDGRVVAYSPDLAWRAARAYASCCARLGVQDASRKRTSPSKMPGPWAGTVTHTDGGRV
jgi:hypothetical protein